MDRTEEICEIVSDVQDKYREQQKAYVGELTAKVNEWFESENIPMDLRHALMCYAHTIGDDMRLDFAFELAMQDYDSSTPKVNDDEKN